MNRHAPHPRVTAVLGPTNTGKTHLAVDRMLGHSSGMIGFPLRLLARENYDRICREKGPRSVALITGEEKISPRKPRWLVCTVESMPLDRRVAFLAIDEIQLCADPERGHVFTDRLLHARGEDETMVLGSDTIKPLIRRLVPEAEMISRPRLSTLSYAGQKKLSRLPRRSAVVAFSAADVYAIAELMRRQKGGTAVVLGALSPRTRNAQVGMYQAGDVDFMVATDAIGMGLNMDLDHAAFAKLRKFDGRVPRRLTAAEVGQIAGRAGRHMSDGTFGTTGELGPLDEETVEAVENHRFERLKTLYWRNDQLDFRSLPRLIRSLAAPPPGPEFMRARDAEDDLALRALARDPGISAMAAAPTALRLLWEVCRIPDFRKVLSDAHARLLGRIYRHLMQGEGRLPEDWVARAVARLDRTEGDIDTLVNRIAHVRTWTYVSNRSNWLDDAQHWQERTRAIEDTLSDVLHEQLTQRFVDRRAAVLTRRLDGPRELLAAVTRTGDVVVEGEHIGRLEGFRFIPDATGVDGQALLTAARRALGREIKSRLSRFERATDQHFTLAPDGRIGWRDGEFEAPVGRLASGPEPLRPSVEPMQSDLLDGAAAERVRRRLLAWLGDFVRQELAPLFRVTDADLPGPARGVAFQLGEGLGVLMRGRQSPDLERQLRALTRANKRELTRLGVRVGTETVFIPALLKPRAARFKTMLWVASTGASVVSTVAPGGVSVPVDLSLPGSYYRAAGYRVLGPRAVRVDMAERLAAAARRLARNGPFAPSPELLPLAGCGKGEIAGILAALGYRAEVGEGGVAFSHRRRGAPSRGSNGKQKARPNHRRRKPKPVTGDDSPFAKLHDSGLPP